MLWSRAGLFFQQLGQMLESGLPPAQAVTLAAQTAGGTYARHAAQWAAAVQAGQPISTALAHGGPGPYACAVLRAGEAGGRAPQLCRELAESFALRHRLATAALSRLIYPVVLLHAALLAPCVPRVVLGTSSPLILLLGPGLLWGGLGATALGFHLAGKRGLLSHLLLRWPCTALTWPALVADISSILRAGLGAGMLVSDTLDLAAGACANRIVADRLRLAATDLRQQRLPDLTAALRRIGVPEADLALVASAEASGRLEQGLGHLRTVAAERFAMRLDWTCRVATGTIYAIAMLAAVITIFSMWSQTYGAALKEIE